MGPPSNASATAPLGSVTYRVATGDSDASEPEESFSLGAYDPNDIDIEEMKAAAEDPNRIRCVTELGSSHVVSLRTELDHPTKILFNNFIDEMFHQLARPYTTSNNETIKASRATVTNIARAFAQARLLDINLARKTQALFVEPENLLTIVVPTTGLPKKEIYRGEHSATYISYHKTSWESVAKILVENCVRPASWTKNEAGIPTQYPCYGFFGYSCEIADTDEYYIHMKFESSPPTSTRLEKDKTHQAFWPFAGLQKAYVPNPEETNKSNDFVLSKALQGARTVPRP